MKRFLAEPVARQKEALPVAVPKRKREHPGEVLQTLWSPALPGVDDRFCITVVSEAVTFGFQLAPELLKIIDLTIEDDYHRIVLVIHGLVTALHVNDG